MMPTHLRTFVMLEAHTYRANELSLDLALRVAASQERSTYTHHRDSGLSVAWEDKNELSNKTSIWHACDRHLDSAHLELFAGYSPPQGDDG